MLIILINYSLLKLILILILKSYLILINLIINY
jgi:hypothetical protein